MKIDRTVDATIIHGCAIPIILAKKELNDMEAGQIVEIISKKGLANDFQAWVKHMNCDLLDYKEENGKLKFYIQKK